MRKCGTFSTRIRNAVLPQRKASSEKKEDRIKMLNIVWNVVCLSADIVVDAGVDW